MATGKKLYSAYVSNMALKTTHEEIIRLFRDCGEIANVYIKNSSPSDMYKFGFVTFYHEEDLLRAVKDLNDWKLHGSRLLVEPSRCETTVPDSEGVSSLDRDRQLDESLWRMRKLKDDFMAVTDSDDTQFLAFLEELKTHWDSCPEPMNSWDDDLSTSIDSVRELIDDGCDCGTSHSGKLLKYCSKILSEITQIDPTYNFNLATKATPHLSKNRSNLQETSQTHRHEPIASPNAPQSYPTTRRSEMSPRASPRLIDPPSTANLSPGVRQRSPVDAAKLRSALGRGRGAPT